MTQTDPEIVALVARAIHQRFPLVLKYEAENLASVAVAALTEAGRLVPPDAAMNGKDEVAALERAYEACFLRPCNMAVFHSVLATHGWRLFRCQNPQKVKAHWLPDLDAEPTPWR